MAASGGTKAIVAAFFANLGIAIAKLAGFFITGASSMLAEAVHSFADTGNQALLLLGQRRGRKAADPTHQFGYGRERFFWAFVVSVVLFALGSLFAIFEGVHKLQHPEAPESVTVALGILAVAMVLEGFSFRTAIHESRKVKGSRTWTQFIRGTKSPELPVVLLEDLGAMVGLVIAFVAILLAWKVDPVFDGVGTLIIGALLGFISVVLAVEMKSLLVGEPASPEDEALIRASMEAVGSVDRIIHMRTEHIGPDRILLAAKVAFLEDMTTADLATSIDTVEAAVREAVPATKLIYLEPDLFRTRQAREDMG